jgi:hypothetical protein
MNKTPAIADNPVNFRNPAKPDCSPTRLDIDSRLPDYQKRNPKMNKWEYATVPLLLHKEAQILNAWGVDGWELVAVESSNQGGLIAFMKRPVA